MPFRLCSSPFLLIATIHRNYSEPESKKMNTLYMDDFVSGSASPESAIQNVMEKAGMKLRKWSSNVPQREKNWKQVTLKRLIKK